MVASTGIEGFDELAGGGLPEGRTTLVLGGPGSGKTLFTLQWLWYGAETLSEPGVYVCFEETAEEIADNLGSLGRDTPSLIPERLAIIEAAWDPAMVRAGAFDLQGLLARVEAACRRINARRVVFDGVDMLLRLLPDAGAETVEWLRLDAWIGRSDITGLITAKFGRHGGDLPDGRQHFLPYLVDAIVVLRNQAEGSPWARSLQVQKIRGHRHSTSTFPMTISDDGLHVLGVPSQELDHPVFDGFVSSGIGRLDTMLGSGYRRGTGIMVSGAPGTAKTTLGGAFLLAACQRGEPSLFVSFDEAGAQIARNLRSVGIDLAPFVESGLLRFLSLRADASAREEHIVALDRAVRQTEAHCLVIDPISAITHQDDTNSPTSLGTRIIDFAKSRGITLLVTSLLDTAEPTSEATESHISTIADTWMHLSFAVLGGERNRALTIVKSRGTGHSNQVRELVLSANGPSLADVFTAGGEVLMGTARLEKEQELKDAEARHRQSSEQHLRTLRTEERRLEAERAHIEEELAARRAEIQTLGDEEADRRSREDLAHEAIHRARSGDCDRQ